jgi:hypothetical protein
MDLLIFSVAGIGLILFKLLDCYFSCVNSILGIQFIAVITLKIFLGLI